MRNPHSQSADQQIWIGLILPAADPPIADSVVKKEAEVERSDVRPAPVSNLGASYQAPH